MIFFTDHRIHLKYFGVSEKYVCISMFPLLIWKKIKEILNIRNPKFIMLFHVAYKTVGLSSCRTIELSDWRSDPFCLFVKISMVFNFYNFGLMLATSLFLHHLTVYIIPWLRREQSNCCPLLNSWYISDTALNINRSFNLPALRNCCLGPNAEGNSLPGLLPIPIDNWLIDPQESME